MCRVCKVWVHKVLATFKLCEKSEKNLGSWTAKVTVTCKVNNVEKSCFNTEERPNLDPKHMPRVGLVQRSEMQQTHKLSSFLFSTKNSEKPEFHVSNLKKRRSKIHHQPEKWQACMCDWKCCCCILCLDLVIGILWQSSFRSLTVQSL